MKWSTEAKVGIFSLAGVLLFAYILFYLSHLALFGKSGYHVTAYFNDAEGIEPGNAIHYAGVDVGMVEGVKINDGKAVLVLRIYHEAEIPKDANFSIQTGNVMGGRFVKIIGGHKDAGYLEDGMSVKGQSVPGIDAAVDKMDKLMSSAQTMLDGINTIVGDKETQNHVRSSIYHFDIASKNLAELTAQGMNIAHRVEGIASQVEMATGSVNSLLTELNHDGKVPKDTRKILDNLVEASENAKDLSKDAKVFSGRLSGLMSVDNLSGSSSLLYNMSEHSFSPNVEFRIGRDRYFSVGVDSLGNDNLFNAQYGKNFGKFNVSGGVIHNKLGVGIRYEKNKWKFGAQVYDPNDITLKLYGTYEFRPNVYFIGQGVLPDHRVGSGVYLGLGYDY